MKTKMIIRSTLLGLITLCSFGLSAQVTFNPPADIASTSRTHVITADIDGDGNLDIIIGGTYSGGKISVFENVHTSGALRDSSFSSAQSFTTGDNAEDIVAADFDGDGKIDIATANSGDDNVSILRNTSSSGSISFATAVDSSAGEEPYLITIGDIDGNGKPDIIVANSGKNTLQILLNKSSSGTINFDTPVQYGMSNDPKGIATADFDGDGKDDIIFGYKDIYVAKSTSSSSSVSFNTAVKISNQYGPTTGSYLYFFFPTDLNGDGDIDILFSNGGYYSTKTFGAVENNTTGSSLSFGSVVYFTSNSIAVTSDTGDFNNDGKVDVMINSGSAQQVYLNNSSSGNISASFFDDPEAITMPTLQYMASGDLNGDGLSDIAGVDYTNLKVSQNTYGKAPLIDNISPSGGMAGTTVTITGSKFDATATNNYILIGTSKVSVSTASTTSLTFNIPAGIETDVYDLAVVSNGNYSLAAPFLVTDVQSNVKWAVTGKTEKFARAASVELNSQQDVISSGISAEPTVFDTTTVNNDFGIYLWSNDSSGNTKWISTLNVIGATSLNAEKNGADLAIDNNDNIYMTGYFGGKLSDGSITKTSLGQQDFFLAKFNSNGVVQWISSGGTSTTGGPLFNSDLGYAVDLDGNGNAYMVGTFYGNTASFGNNITASGIAGADAFLAKYDSDGDAQWAVSIGGKMDDETYDVATTSNGHSYITGVFEDTMSINGTHLGVVDTNWFLSTETKSFLAKYDQNGNALWATDMLSNNQIISKTLALDENDNVYVAGRFTTNAYFANDTLYADDANRTSKGFIAKYTKNGQFLWVEAINMNIKEIQYQNGQLFLGGIIEGSTYMDPYLLNTNSRENGAIIRMDTTGIVYWAEAVNDEMLSDRMVLASSAIIDLAVDGQQLYSTGYFKDEAAIGNKLLLSMDEVDIFTARFRTDTLPTQNYELTITQPSGGSYFETDTVDICWNNSNNITKINIHYDFDRDGNWRRIAENVDASDGCYEWVIPKVSSSGQITRIRIQDAERMGIEDTTDQALEINKPTPIVNFINPSDNEDVKALSGLNVEWDAKYVDRFILEWSADGGQTYTQLSQIWTSTTHQWFVPDTTSSQAVLRLRNLYNPSEILDSVVFNIVTADPVSINILKPAGGETLAYGNKYDIQFIATSVEWVTMKYTTDNGQSWTNISSFKYVADEDTSHYNWSIPNVKTSTARIAVIMNGNDAIADTTGVFDILDANVDYVTVTYPNGGENIASGGFVDIEWQTNLTGNANIHYTTDNGSSWQMVAKVIDLSAKKVQWTVPSVQTNQARVMITPQSDSSLSDMSDATFTISGGSGSAPTPPSNLQVIVINKKANEGKIRLTWQDNSNNEDGFIIFSSEDDTLNFVAIDSVGTDVEEYVDSLLQDGTEYFYYVVAYNSFGNSAPSNKGSGITSIAELPDVHQLKIFPNPVSGNMLNISFELTRHEQIMIRLLDVQGKVVSVIANRQFSYGTHQLQIHELPIKGGTYFLEMLGSSGRSIQKVKVSR